MFKLPYSLLPFRTLKQISHNFRGVGEYAQHAFPSLDLSLKQAKLKISAKEYLSICFVSNMMLFAFFGSMITAILFFAGVDNPYVPGLFVSLLVVFFAFFQQAAYPKIFVNKRVKDIERNLLAALQNILIQLKSGIPLFDILVNISKGGYGGVSEEFMIVVKQINAGKPQTETLEEMVAENPSIFFRRSIWHIINGIKSGANMALVITEIMDLLSEERVLQIQKYGGQLNPLAMFYMLVVVIGPSIGMTFLIMLSSFVSLSEFATKLVFWSLYGMVFFFQLMFMGIIKSKRPNLLGD
ncbi:MAG: type II secretion system F family protein [Nanoarchaeota archaeon]